MVIGASSSEAMAFATAKRSPDGSPPRDWSSAAPDVVLREQGAQHRGQVRPRRPAAEPEQGDARRVGGPADRRGQRHRGADDECGGTGPARARPAAAPPARGRRGRHRARARGEAAPGRPRDRGSRRRRSPRPPRGRRGRGPARWRPGRRGHGRGWRAASSCWRARAEPPSGALSGGGRTRDYFGRRRGPQVRRWARPP